MKRIAFGKLVMIFIIGVILLCGCTSPPKETSAERTHINNPGSFSSAYNDTGVVFFGNSNEHNKIAYFFDPESGTCAPLCTKINCGHKGYSPLDNPNPDCDAFLDDFSDCATIIGEHLYYIAGDNEGFRYKNFCKADLSGTNRVIIHHIEAVENCNFACYENGYLIYVYYNKYDEQGNQKDVRHPGIYLLNLETEKTEHIDMPETYEGYIGMATIDHETLYYFYSYLTESLDKYTYEEFSTLDMQTRLRDIGRLELWAYDLATKEKTCLWSLNGEQYYGYSLLGYGYLFMEERNGKAHLENLQTGKAFEMDAVVAADKNALLCEDGVILCGDKSYSIWRYDTGEIEELGSYEHMILMVCITENWVYARVYDEENQNWKLVYLPWDRFRKGELEWKAMPEM